MEDHNFILWDQDGEPNYDNIIENDNDMENDMELSDMIEEQVEGYEEVNILEENSENDEAYYIDDETMIPVPQENLTYLADESIVNGSSQIGVGMSYLIEQRVQEAESKIIGDQDADGDYTATVEEVITEDWPLEGEDMVQVAMEQVVTSDNFHEDGTEIVPLHTDQDEYTTNRPYPCDFCSRRFRKKANLMNHMVAHQNVRPHMCNLCGSRYVRKCDLINHLKIHAYNIEDDAVAGPSTSGKKKPPKYVDMDFFNETYEDIPDDDDFDYNHYSKPTASTAPPRVTKPAVKKKPAKKTAVKFEKLTKEKPIMSDLNITFGDTRSEDEITQMASYVERFPITDPRKPFVCQHCGVAFTREKALESHTKLHANQEPTYDCELCGDSFFDSTSLEEHLELRHDFSSRIRKTGGKSTSGKTSRTAKVLETMEYDDSNSEYEPDKNNDELDEEDEEEELPNSCDKCHMSFKTPEALKRHIKTHFIKSEVVSDEERPQTIEGTSLGCNVCGESFTEALDLLAHAEIHARFQPFKCQLCGDTFFEENKIKIHLMDNHETELTESSCRLCGKQCRDQRSLIKHSWEHSREKNHPCSKCGKTFHNKARLKRHMASHKNKSVICEICQEEFPDGRQLMNHRHSHTKANQFPCHECGKTFGSRSSQQIHIRIHTGERPYGCRYCWKAFADGGTLRKHERIHTGEKPYCCLVCPRAFNQRVVLREHIRSHHSAPDPAHGTTLTPFYCSLCGDLFSLSLDLIKHLIEHSDRSTAAKRVQPTGPRKYKRRRKLNGDSDNSDFVAPPEVHHQRVQKVVKQEPIEIDLRKNVLASAFPIPNDSMDFNLPDDIFLSLGKRVPIVKREEEKKPTPRTSTSAVRPKMIFTEKTRVSVTDGKRKTRTMIQKQVVQSKPKPQATRVSRQQLQLRQKDEEIFEHDESSETWSNDDPNEDVLDTLLKRERKLSEKFTMDLVNDLQDILRSPLKTNEDKNHSNGDGDADELDFENLTRRSRRPTTSRYGSPYKRLERGGKKGRDALSEDDSIFIKQEVCEDGHSCEICGEAFETREELLGHVPIHI